jgi:hypothetical protein
MAELDDLAQQFRDVRTRAAALVAPLSEAQFNWRARPGSFSVAECLVHLNVADAMLAGCSVRSRRASAWSQQDRPLPLRLVLPLVRGGDGAASQAAVALARRLRHHGGVQLPQG